MKKRYRYILLVICALCLLLACALLYHEINARRFPVALCLAVTQAAPVLQPSEDETAATTPAITSDAEPYGMAGTSVIKPSSAPYAQTVSKDFGSISIKGKTFTIKRGIDDAALKKNIGWMETSAQPGQDGVCVLMGHRNKEFRILKDVSTNDTITITDANGNRFEYAIQSIEVIEDELNLKFIARDGKTLMLLTCFPFYYHGHAPQRFLVRASASS